MSSEIAEIRHTDSSFKCHEFTHFMFNFNVKFEIVKMKDSILIWIGDFEKPLLLDLSYGVQTKYEPLPTTTKILGTASSDTASMMIAKRLAKKLKKPVYISFNLPLTPNNLLKDIEIRLIEEIELHSDKF